MTRAKIAVAVGTLGLLGAATVGGFSVGQKGVSHCNYREGGALPDPVCTPGATNASVTQQTIGQTICVRGWTATIRPPTSITGPEKIQSMKEYGVSNPRDYEYDHLISLELGGAANDTRNLWPEPHVTSVWIDPNSNNQGSYQGSFAKDKIENRLKREICSGKITLVAAQRIISTDWRRAP